MREKRETKRNGKCDKGKKREMRKETTERGREGENGRETFLEEEESIREVEGRQD